MAPEIDPIEPDLVLTDAQNWSSRSHLSLYQAVHHNNDPGLAGEIGHEWSKYGTELTESARALTAQIAASESKWTGDAAEVARAAMRKLVDWIDETADTAVGVGVRVAEQGRIMETARAQMPEPLQFDWNKAVAELSQPGTGAFVAASADIAAANERSRAAHEQAVAVMTTMENSSRQIDTSTPVFKPPFNPATGRVEQPIMAMRMMSGVPALGGAEALTAGQGHHDGATSPGTATGTATTPPAASAPRGPAVTDCAPSGAPGAGSSCPPPPASSPNHGTMAAASYAPPQPQQSMSHAPAVSPTSASGNDYRPPFSSPPFPGMAQNGGMSRQNATPAYNPATASAPGAGGKPPVDRNLSSDASPRTGSGVGGGGAAAAAVVRGGGGGFGGGPGAFSGTGGATGPLQPGGSSGVAAGQGTRSGIPLASLPGASAAAGGAPMGGAPGSPAGGRGETDKEHRSASYVMGGDLFEVPGADLPPSVIGAASPRKKGPEQP